MHIEEVQAPPIGFRKAIPAMVKLHVVLRQHGKCATCGEHLNALSDTEFDHCPAIQLRTWDPFSKDTIPPANSIEHIFAKHCDCHDAKTFGTKATSRGSDIGEIAHTRRLTRKEQEFRQRLLAKAAGKDPESPKKQKRQWPKRKFNGGRNGNKDRPSSSFSS